MQSYVGPEAFSDVIGATAEGGLESAKNEIWLPFLDTYRTLCLAPDRDFEQILTEMRTAA